MKTFDLVDQLNQITCPTLVAGGCHDWINPVEASILIAEKIPDSELTIFEKSCHHLFIDENREFISRISSFINERFGLQEKAASR
ncbi:alpha/beta fold hydrolase [Peribacillus sp. NPDC096447]|uniref:alpha/beta fold hydrolase n=1 Tax=Peribacillus sp. NPDC096447 TaxID=3364394 RepID=UPI003806F41E